MEYNSRCQEYSRDTQETFRKYSKQNNIKNQKDSGPLP